MDVLTLILPHKEFLPGPSLSILSGSLKSFCGASVYVVRFCHFVNCSSYFPSDSSVDVEPASIPHASSKCFPTISTLDFIVTPNQAFFLPIGHNPRTMGRDCGCSLEHIPVKPPERPTSRGVTTAVMITTRGRAECYIKIYVAMVRKRDIFLRLLHPDTMAVELAQERSTTDLCIILDAYMY